MQSIPTTSSVTINFINSELSKGKKKQLRFDALVRMLVLAVFHPFGAVYWYQRAHSGQCICIWIKRTNYYCYYYYSNYPFSPLYVLSTVLHTMQLSVWVASVI